MQVDKIKTLGDCYVAGTGILSPTGRVDHAANMCKFACGMQQVARRSVQVALLKSNIVQVESVGGWVGE
jgi:hypothetical protein